MNIPAFIRKLIVRVPHGENAEIVVPDNLFVACPQCKASLYNRKLAHNLNVCPLCGFHLTLSSVRWIEILSDRKSWRPLFDKLRPVDTLAFPGYADKLRSAMKKGDEEAISTGRCQVNGHSLLLGVMNPQFFMGSLGSVAGEKIACLFEMGLREHLPVLLVIRSGGARMQEGVLSLMQMAKTAAAIQRFSAAGLLYITLLTHPTTGGVSASFAMLGDITLAEPGALIGFAGPRVIELTIRQKLPDDFQKAEYVLAKGFVDAIVPRAELRNTLEHILDLHRPQGEPRPASPGAPGFFHNLHQRWTTWFKNK
jgi:acetyl-CoA carboxylase carboxyl transferase subunit beta